MAIFRGERWEVSYGIESVAGSSSAPDTFFGIFEKATLADPEIEYLPFWGIADGAGRTYTMAYKGKWTMNASIGDVLLLNGAPLQLPIGAYAASTASASPYTHTATSTTTLPSITMMASMWDSDASAGASPTFIRQWVGGKVNKASFTAEEGGQLKMGIDEIMFLDFTHNSTNATAVKYAAGLTQPTITLPTTEPYYFSMGSLSLAGTTFCRVKSFKIDINNNCEPKYYICNPTGVSGNVPVEILEGKREIGFTCSVDVSDTSLYGELLREGIASGATAFTGFDISLVFTRGSNDTITFTMPPAAAATGAHAQGCLIKKANIDITGDPVIPQELDILVRDIKVTVVDSTDEWN